jgi:Tol biopolymer transport system component
MTPFWSPDGESIGFFADGKLKVLSLAGGPPRILCDTQNTGAGGASWSRSGAIVFGLGSGPLYRVSESGGTPVAVTTLDQEALETGHIRPHFLPDGQRFLFLATAAAGRGNRTYVGSLDSPERTRLDGIASSVEFAPPGYLLFARDATLLAQEFDPDRVQLSGEPMALGEVRQNVAGAAAFSVSPTGILVRLEPLSGETQLMWASRDGKVVGSFRPHVGIHTFSLAPDQERVIVEDFGGSGDLWILDRRRETVSRFTTDPGSETHPLWSPDGRRIAFTGGVAAEGRRALMLKDASGVSESEVILKTPTATQLTDWSVDGRTLVFEQQSSDLGWNVGVVAVDGDRTPRLVVRSRFQERMGTLSPDGRYLAYTSDETGRPGVYVVTFPDISEKWTVSTGGATGPRWRRDGTELFFVDAAGMLMSVSVSRTPRFEIGVPRPLFELQGIATDGFTYAVSGDGDRVLIARPTTTASTPLRVIVNWRALLNK